MKDCESSTGHHERFCSLASSSTAVQYSPNLCLSTFMGNLMRGFRHVASCVLKRTCHTFTCEGGSMLRHRDIVMQSMMFPPEEDPWAWHVQSLSLVWSSLNLHRSKLLISCRKQLYCHLASVPPDGCSTAEMVVLRSPVSDYEFCESLHIFATCIQKSPSSALGFHGA